MEKIAHGGSLAGRISRGHGLSRTARSCRGTPPLRCVRDAGRYGRGCPFRAPGCRPGATTETDRMSCFWLRS
ncbi:hypothetical protein F750_3443 [Streptomyces sp. PAMC 26508]|nr:hypothetical protein F750_3443 [Streptomyces sp. PAMC 26508]